MELGEQPRRLGVALGPAPCLDHRLGAEILENEEAEGEVLAEMRGAGTEGPQAPVDGHEGVDALGELDDGAVGLAVAHRRPVGPGRRDRQDGGCRRVRPGARRRGSRRRPASGRARPVPAAAQEQLLIARARSSGPMPPLPSMRTTRALAGSGPARRRERVGPPGRSAIGPLDQRDGILGHLVEAELDELVRAAQAVEVGMHDRARPAPRRAGRG